MSVDELVLTFRQKYPGSTEEQVEGYRQAVLAEQANPPAPPAPEVPMPLIVVPAPAPPTLVYAPAPPTKMPADLREDLKETLLGTYGLYLRLPPAVQHRIRTEDLSESELLGLIVNL
jgi:hypothetical protein